MGRIWTRIINTLRCGALDSAEVSVDRHTLQLADEQIRDAEERIDTTRSSLAGLMAKSLVASRDVLRIEKRLAVLISDAERALEAGREDAALKIATEIGMLEMSRTDVTHNALEFGAAVSSLRVALKTSEDKLSILKNQIEVVRTNHLAQQACLSSSVAEGGSSLRIRNVAQSLNAIRQRQRETAARLQVEEELNFPERDLERRLRDACISPDTPNANSVLSRIKNHSSQETI
ncbi:PspA/IM30 family protein [Pseudomonas syringae USA007]|uniref:PspA/IM30 family protein n=1 Tax=Pseudomonas syringae USA007 TaxID=1357288 RepID=A0AAU8M5X5_PSESX|nr:MULTISPECIES: PspA/IM30 family protein [Pseudomonas syringae group]